MIRGPEAQRIKAHLMIWWIIWIGVLAGLGLIYFFCGRDQAAAPRFNRQIVDQSRRFPPVVCQRDHPLVGLATLLQIRARAFVVFIIGPALAEAWVNSSGFFPLAGPTATRCFYWAFWASFSTCRSVPGNFLSRVIRDTFPIN